MGKDKCSDKSKQKEIRDLERRKNKAKEKNDFLEAANICNYIGEILYQDGFFEEAIKEHKEEIYFSEAGNNVIGVAIGNRKVGECFTEMECFEEALEYQQKHLKIAKSVSNSLEQQRALATIGRTYFRKAECLPGDKSDDINTALMKAQDAYLRSLDICSSLSGKVSDKEILEMKARLYLNLGLIYENRQNYNEAMRFVSKALVISREQKLQDNVFRCHHTLSGLYLSTGDVEKSLQSSKAAVMIAQKEKSMVYEIDSLAQMGLALLHLGDFVAGLNTLKQVYKLSGKSSGVVDPLVIANMKLAMKAIKLVGDSEKCEDKNELLSLCEKLGDLYSELQSPEKALKYYLQQLQVAESLNHCGKSLANIYVSVAITYGECKQYDKSLEYYYKELDVKHGELAEKSSSYCAIAACLENLDSPFEEIKDCYMKALECAQGSGNHIAEMKVYRDWSATLRSYNFIEELKNVELKMKYITEEYNIPETVDDSEETGHENLTSQTFCEEELLMLESDNDEDDVEEMHLAGGSEISKRKTSRQIKKKVNKVNERGETPLHCAAISGDYEKAMNLLQQGASVSARDYCGWQPLHEACNHGHVDIAERLVQHGASVNDPGGQHCGNITPLHDASQNGHIEVVKLLVSNGADTGAKTKEGWTPLQLVQMSIKADEEEFSNHSEETTIMQKRKQVEQYLKNSQRQRPVEKIPELSEDRNKKIFESLFGDDDDDDDEFDDDDDDDLLCQQQQQKRKKLDVVPCRDIHNDVDVIVLQNTPHSVIGENIVEGFNSDIQSSSEHVEDFDEDSNSSLIIGEGSNQQFKNTKTIKAKQTYTYNDIDFRRSSSSSVCTSLLPEGEVILHDFIVDDIGTTTKRKRQSKIKYPIKLDFVENSNFNTSNGVKVKKKNIASKSLKQKRIEGYVDMEHTDTDSNDSNPPVALPSHVDIVQDTNYENQQTSGKQPNLFRIKIRVNQQLFLIPCQNAKESTVGWLVAEAKQRYHNFCGVSTKLVLKTKDGALLNLADNVNDVIMNNEEVIGDVVGLDLPPFIERYKTFCKEKHIRTVAQIADQLDQSLSDLHLKDMYLPKSALEAVFTSISCSMGLTALNLIGVFIGDLGFTYIVNCLYSLPSISVLKFSCIGITTKSLQDLSKVVDGIKEEYKVIMSEPPLCHLTTLHLNYNDFQNNGLFVMTMAKILVHCKNLTDLNLESCKLGPSIFNSVSPFRSALKESKVSSFNLSDNNMEGSDFISNVFNSISKECITSLDLSRTLTHNDRFEMTKIWKCLEDLECLKELRLDALPNHISDDIANNISIERLSLQYQDGSFDSLASICRSCIQMKNLTYLDLSFSKNINNDLFELLLMDLKQNVSIKNLLLKCCAIKSPLHASTFCKFSELNNNGLSSLDLSYNEIEEEDKKKLFDSWNIVHGSFALQEFEQCKCLLFVRK